jgi:hypothetical protein
MIVSNKLSPAKAVTAQQRRQKLAAALRVNLRRRKAGDREPEARDTTTIAANPHTSDAERDLNKDRPQ